MPPKGKGGGGGGAATNKKAEQKKKEKIIEDKTFGLKNKNKSKAVQKYIKGVQTQVQGPKKPSQSEFDKKKKLEEEKEREKLEKELFKPVITQPKVPLGVDPKSVICQFFKMGMCNKGDKCKFSHNLNVERKSEKPDLYVDLREGFLNF